MEPCAPVTKGLGLEPFHQHAFTEGSWARVPSPHLRALVYKHVVQAHGLERQPEDLGWEVRAGDSGIEEGKGK